VYYENSELFARHLTEAAQEGEASGDYSRYHAIQKQLAAETTAVMLSPYAGVLSAVARDRALKEAESRHPGFTELLQENRDSLKKERPTLDNAISYAEQDPRLREDLLQLYESANDYLLSKRGAGDRQTDTQTARQAGSSLSVTEISQLPLEERRRVLESMRENLGDTPVDVADTSSQTNY
jgi:hypothetical protein